MTLIIACMLASMLKAPWWAYVGLTIAWLARQLFRLIIAS